jgi:hypothetical protein
VSTESGSTAHSEEGPWGLRGDLIITNAILWVAGAGRVGEPKPEVHLYLYDRYSRLADHYDRRGNKKKALRLRAKAEAHYNRSGHTGPPFAAAMAMPRPRSPFFTWAVAKDRDRRGPNDAA